MWRYFNVSILASFAVVSCSEKPQVEDTANVEPAAPSEKKVEPLPELVSFNEHIQPILSANCYHCHGPDGGSRMPEGEPLRVDKADDVFSPRANGKPVVVKGDPDASYMLQLMETDDVNKVMPPDPSKSPHGKIMDQRDIQLVRKWIEQGAEFEDHWAYIAPKKNELPEVEKSDWPRNPLDNYVLAKMEAAGVEPNPEQSNARLLRRLYFDLTGLPPAADELKKILADTRDFDVVYAETVDKLLNSQEYAENFARHWLDVARYADTHGIHIDNYRSIWPYRDWVLEAFKNNMPFDQFTREQISGDMMVKASNAQKVATGFLRCLPTTGEGGSIAEEVRAMNMQDMTDTVAATWLGLTTGCASCHDHKFDAISTKENYQLTAFFNNTPMSPLDGNNEKHPPYVFLPKKGEEASFDALVAKINKLTHESRVHQQQNHGNFAKWLTTGAKDDMVQSSEKLRTLRIPLNGEANGLKVEGAEVAATPKQPIQWVDGPGGQAAKFENNNIIDLGQVGEYEYNQPFGFSFWIKIPETNSAGVISKMDAKNKYRGYDIYVEGQGLAMHVVDEWPTRALKVSCTKKLPIDTWTHVTVTYDGSATPHGVKMFINGQSERVSATQNTLKDGKEAKSIKTDAPFIVGSRYGANYFNGGAIQNIEFFNKPLSDGDAFAVYFGQKLENSKKDFQMDDKEKGLARVYYFESVDPKSSEMHTDLVNSKQEKLAYEARGHYSLVMQEKTNSKPTAQVLIRGQYNVKDDEILSAGTPAALPPMTEDMPKNRLGLGMWLTDPANPLPARVTVNRYWSYIFGKGIVESVGDFGVMGSRPSHPKLLDWLAVDFVESGWDMHQLMRNIVTSSTYRQSAVLTADKMVSDPDNKLYSRGPRYRLDAEQIRDLALSASGLLNNEFGGPSVKPYQPEKIWESVAMPTSNTRFYKRDSGDKVYRRSMYTFLKRTAPHPAMDILNAPMREVSCVQRELTNTPLQAFVVMNDPQFIEASRQLADDAIQNSDALQDRANWISKRLLSRELTGEEIKIIDATYQKALKQFEASPEQAEKLVAIGDSKATTTEQPELASWTLVASQILNMDETLNK
ncbi:DUF1553 domain-containing protein [Rubritalea marina]|uniref:DUF1553 domain-containing protein n=1 Tax=Rubritalea marina TaxID=361055 RepID=UPI00036C7815|nr:DUF1553 domain-containing protein [Rubritalea marina]